MRTETGLPHRRGRRVRNDRARAAIECDCERNRRAGALRSPASNESSSRRPSQLSRVTLVVGLRGRSDGTTPREFRPPSSHHRRQPGRDALRRSRPATGESAESAQDRGGYGGGGEGGIRSLPFGSGPEAAAEEGPRTYARATRGQAAAGSIIAALTPAGCRRRWRRRRKCLESPQWRAELAGAPISG